MCNKYHITEMAMIIHCLLQPRVTPNGLHQKTLGVLNAFGSLTMRLLHARYELHKH